MNTIEVTANAGPNQTICEGESVTLTASGGVSYLWNTGATTSTITVSPGFNYIYIVTAYGENDDSDSDSVTVFVNDLPVINTNDDITILYGESTTLTASGGSEYLWSNGETSQSIQVSPETTTTYTVTGFENGCSSESSVTVTVEGNVEANAGENQRVCENYGYEIELTASGGDSYLWSTGDTTQTISVNPLSTTTYSVIAYQGEFEDEDHITVYVDPNPEVEISSGEAVTILDGDYVTLSATGANEYEWSNGATQPNIAVNPQSTTTYEVIGYINDCYDAKQVTVNVLPQVIASVEGEFTICKDESTILTAVGGDEYLWSTGETTQSIEVSPESTEDYTVTVFNALDYDETTVTVEVDTICGEIPTIEESSFEFRIYPNPTSDVLNIKLAGLYSTSKLYIYDISGKIIISETMDETVEGSPFTKQLNLNNLNSGLYLLKLIYDDKEIIEKVMIQ